MSNPNKKYSLNTVSVKLGCGSTCRTPKILSAVFRRKRRYSSSSTSSSWDTTPSTVDTTPGESGYSSDPETDVRSLRAVQGFGKIGGASVAVEKDSDDPYLDFRRSMLQMILEKEIYSKDDLKELLNCFLQLNSPYYHGIIVRAFTEIWNGVYSVGNSDSASAYYNLHGTSYY
ncbi:hypothetical protein CDL12_21419 [Handroanthus impetiginosus]|uniref:Transcription repressor n=1 Tax=Handroanthus impetiginosus TaxID=429701 RepID=A0A2G9GL40_9LAMI|nr:hypothetical protein CDL12_21419 [Handroanthus impetiginosus]